MRVEFKNSNNLALVGDIKEADSDNIERCRLSCTNNSWK